eukprot:scaffold270_cov207-Alexandrium_tamarense.AAC.12
MSLRRSYPRFFAPVAAFCNIAHENRPNIYRGQRFTSTHKPEDHCSIVLHNTGRALLMDQ